MPSVEGYAAVFDSGRGLLGSGVCAIRRLYHSLGRLDKVLGNPVSVNVLELAFILIEEGNLSFEEHLAEGDDLVHVRHLQGHLKHVIPYLVNGRNLAHLLTTLLRA